MKTRKVKDYLTGLPDEILFKKITPELQANDHIHLSHVSRNLHDFYNKFTPFPWQEILRTLLSHAALGNLVKAEAIWRNNPDFLACYGTIYHPNRIDNADEEAIDIPLYDNPGRYKYVNCTFWQILLMNEEYKEASKVAEYMTKEARLRQFKEIFPSNNIEKYEWNFSRAKRLLHDVFEALKDDKTINREDLTQANPATRAALHAFYDYVKPKPEHSIGLVFDANLYLEALKIYDTNSQSMNVADWWFTRIEEWLAGCLGTALLRHHARGIEKRNHPFYEQDNFPCQLGNGTSYFAFRRSNNSIPGRHFFVRPNGAATLGIIRGSNFWQGTQRQNCSKDAHLLAELILDNNKQKKVFMEKMRELEKNAELISNRYC